MDMATNRDSPLEKLAQQITCPICMDIYCYPKALLCLHTYCKECVQKLIHRRSKDQEITCPQCRKAVPVTGNNVNNLPTVFFINELIDTYNAMKQASENVEIACQNCSKGKAVAFCQSCDERGMFICATCESAHKLMKVFTGHKVMSLTDLKKGSLIHLPSKKLPTFSCSKHDGELKKLYCFTCSQLICRDCTFLDHPKDRNHKYDFVNSVASAFKNELNVKLLPIEDAHTAVAQAVSQVEASKKAITEQGESIERRITCAFDELQELLAKHKKQLLRQVGESIERKMGTLERQQNDLEMVENECKRVVYFVRLTSASACDEEIVIMQKNIETRLQDLASKTEHIQLTPTVTANMIIATPSKEEMEKLIEKQGFIVFLEESNNGASATTGKASVFAFRLINANNEVSVGTPTVTAELKSLTCRKLSVPAVVNSNSPSVYKVSYTPCKRGRHQLIIRIDTIEVATFPIFVNHPPTSLGAPIRMIKSGSTDYAWRIALSESGDIYFTQHRTGRYVHLDHNGSVECIVKCVSNERAVGIEVESKTGSVFISGSHKLQKYNSRGELVKEIGGLNPGDQPGEFHEPNDIRFYKNRVYVCDSGNGRVQIFDPELNYIHSFGTKGKEIGQLQWPEDIDFDIEGNAYIIDSRKRCVLLFNPTYKFMRDIQLAVTPPLKFPIALRIHGNSMYVSDPYRGVLIHHKSTGKLISCFSENNIDSDGCVRIFPVGIAVDVDGYVYVCQRNYHCVSIY